jgi:hypothetical protein
MSVDNYVFKIANTYWIEEKELLNLIHLFFPIEFIGLLTNSIYVYCSKRFSGGMYYACLRMYGLIFAPSSDPLPFPRILRIEKICIFIPTGIYYGQLHSTLGLMEVHNLSNLPCVTLLLPYICKSLNSLLLHIVCVYVCVH